MDLPDEALESLRGELWGLLEGLEDDELLAAPPAGMELEELLAPPAAGICIGIMLSSWLRRRPSAWLPSDADRPAASAVGNLALLALSLAAFWCFTSSLFLSCLD